MVPERMVTLRVSLLSLNNGIKGVEVILITRRHALRMGLDMNLHRALDKLADGTEHRSEAEERDLGMSRDFAYLAVS